MLGIFRSGVPSSEHGVLKVGDFDFSVFAEEYLILLHPPTFRSQYGGQYSCDAEQEGAEIFRAGGTVQCRAPYLSSQRLL